MGLIVDAYLAHPDLALGRTIEKVSDVSIRVIPQTATDPETGLFFFRVSSNADADRSSAGELEAFEAFEKALETDPTVAEWGLAIDSSGDRVYQLCYASDIELISPKISRVSGVTLDARSHLRGWLVRLRLPDREALATLWEHCEAHDIDFELERLFQQDDWEIAGATGLTATQREALLTAYEEGYFEEPRATSQQEIADRLDISSTAVGGRIRRGMAKLVETTLVDAEKE